MNDYDRIRDLWTRHDYTGVVSAAWRLPAVEHYPYLRSVVRLHDFTLSELVSRACQQAASGAWSPQHDQTRRQQAIRWVADLLHDFSPPAALVDHGDGDEAEAFRSHMLRAHLLCVSIALWLPYEQGEADAGDTKADAGPAFDAQLCECVSHHCGQIAEETNLPLAFFRDLLYSFLAESKDPHRLPASATTVSLTALLVSKTQRQGVVATLSLEPRSGGSGLCYPTPDLAFVRRDPTFREAEHNACTYVKDAGLWKADHDVRWRVTRRDGQPINTLTGSSMGFAFALGLAKLFTAE
jgi:hypothetical protein